jgi:hypothetical protein
MLSILPATHSPGNSINVIAEVLTSVGDPDLQDPHVLCLLDPGPLVRGMDHAQHPPRHTQPR